MGHTIAAGGISERLKHLARLGRPNLVIDPELPGERFEDCVDVAASRVAQAGRLTNHALQRAARRHFHRGNAELLALAHTVKRQVVQELRLAVTRPASPNGKL